MATYTAFIVSQSLDIEADSIGEAEERYSEFFDNGEGCSKHEDHCECFNYDDSNVFHYFDGENEETNLKNFARVMAKAGRKFSGWSMSANEVMDYIMTEFTNNDDSEWKKLQNAIEEQEKQIEKEDDPEN